ncbi:RHS repeat-associated core domain-containing protein [Anatilimnocola floriformis]|uniref:RHS repeat-associated core domain-containing protein n=1 Tax=Anatilimnocola floriformis TaxID=2948575 RepID=UPI0020C4DCBC|nr:RHS repeat-associated core domain-containing protein [Anatilimnocola floriformis]
MGGSSAHLTSNEVTVYIVRDDNVAAALPDSSIADPPCNCGQSENRTDDEYNPQNGNHIVMPPALGSGDQIYFPRYSTGEFRPAVAAANTQFATRSTVPDSLEVNGIFYDTAGIDTEQTFRISEMLNTTGLAAGRYPYTLEVTEHYASDPDLVYPIDGHVLVSGPSNALMSPGWSIPGIDRLSVTEDGALWQSNGDKLLWFNNVDSGYQRPDGDQDYSTLVDNLNGTYTLTNRWGDTAVFNSLGFVTQKTDRNGRTTTFTYTDADSDSDDDDISEIELFDGRTLTYDYNAGRISGITDFDGREVLIDYDTNDQLKTISYPDPDDAGPLDALVSTYTYASGSSYLETADDNGNESTYTYDFAGALIGRENADGTTENFQPVLTMALVDPGSGLGTSMNPAPITLLEDIVATHQDENGEDTIYVLGPLGLPIKKIDALGNVTTYERDSDGRITKQIDPDPDGAGGESAPQTLYEYDEAGNLIEMTLPNYGVQSWVYDSTWNVPTQYTNELGLVTIYDIDPLTGWVESERQVVGDIDDLINLENDDVVTEYTYTAAPSGPTDPPAGLVETITDPLGRVKVYTYNARGVVTSVTYADGTPDEATTYTYYNADGTIDYELDELSRRTDYDYDVLGHLVLKTLPDPDGGGPLARPEFEYEYDSWNRLVKETDPLERETIYTYDKRGRQTKVELPDHDGDKSLTTTTTTYNDAGQVVATKDPLGRETSYEYDKLGRQTKVTLPEVADPTSAVNEVQVVDFDSGTEGTFKLNGNSTYAVVDLADLSNLQSLLDGIWGAGNTRVEATSTEATITFRGDLAGTNVAQMTVSNITGTKGSTPSVSTDTGGEAADVVNPTTETEYDPLGRVSLTRDALGQETKYEYTYSGTRLQITLPDPDGAGPLSSPILYQVFDVAGNLVSETDANGGVTTREYDILGRLVKVTQPDPDDWNSLTSPVTEYQYDLAGNLRFVTDPLGRVTEYQYDNRNRQVKVITADPDGAGPLPALVSESVYDDAGQLSQTTEPGNRVTDYYYDGLGRLTLTKLPDPDGAGGSPRPELESSYDAAGRKVTDTDALDNVTTYTYDDLDNLIETKLPDPDGVGGAAASVSQWEYDAAGQLLSSTDAMGNVTTYEYDNLGRTIQVTAPDPDGVGGQAAPVTKYQYSLTGNLLQVLDPLKHETNYEYDYLNRRTKSIDALGGETAFKYDAAGNLKSLTDPVDNETEWTYDRLNRVIQEKNELGNSRYFVYDAAGNLRQKTDRNERVTIYEYDELNRQTAEEWWTGTRPSVSVSPYVNGYHGNERQTVGFSEWSAPMTSGTFALTFDGQTTAPIAWDAAPTTVMAALEALSNVGVGDVVVTKIYNSGNMQWWQLDFRGSLAGLDLPQVTVDPSLVDNGSGPPTYEQEYTDYDGYHVNEEQVVSLADTTGGTFQLSFGGAWTAPIDWDATTGDIDSALEALSGVGTVSVTGSAGGPWTIEFTGAYLGQDIATLFSRSNDLTNADLVRTIEYSFNDDGDLESVNDPDATYEYTYDSLGRVANYVQNITGLTPEIEFVSQYNAASRREVLQAILDGNEDFQNTYAYDGLQRLSTLIQQSGADNVVAAKRIEFNYNGLGQYTRLDRYASTDQSEFVASSHYSYDNLNRLLKLVHSETSVTPSGWGTDPLAGYQFSYDPSSRFTSINSYVDGVTDYTHDDTNQLVGADHNTATDESYEYDENGNRIMSGYDVDPNNQLASDGIYNYTYDDEGNRLTRTKVSSGHVTEYEWDFRNRLTKVTEKDNSNNILQVTTNGYDAFNQWIRRSFDADGAGGAAAVENFFVYENGQIVLQFDGDSASDLSHRYLWGDQVDQLFADEKVTTLGSAGTVIWPLGDQVGTLRDLVSYDSGTDDATVSNHREIDSFGNLTDETDPGVDLLFGFTSRPFDETTSLQNNLNRWYDPTAGQWVSEDPIGFSGDSTNIVRYVANSPTSFADPNGLAPMSGGVGGPFFPGMPGSPWTPPPASPSQIWNSKVAAFMAWHTAEKARMTWLASVPIPPSKLNFVARYYPLLTAGPCAGFPVAGFRKVFEPVLPVGWEWDNAATMSVYHPHARWGIRKAGSGGSGAQATYDENGDLITGGLSAGTSDKVSPTVSSFGHLISDVITFSNAAELDSHFGGKEYRDLYYEVRPPNTGDAPPNYLD